MTRMCATNWKCILSSLARGGGSGVLAIVIQGMSLGTKALPRLGQSWTRRQQQLGMTRFEVDAFHRKQTGLRWGRGSHPASLGEGKSPSPHPGRKGQPQQVPHADWISASEHPSLPPRTRNDKTEWPFRAEN